MPGRPSRCYRAKLMSRSMKQRRRISTRVLVLSCSSLLGCCAVFACSSLDVLGERTFEASDASGGLGGSLSDTEDLNDTEDTTTSDEAPNLLDVPISEVNARLNAAFRQLFFGDPYNEAVFVELADGTGYVKDVANGDVRTDSMAYGMLTTVQLDQREVFDKLWAWTKNHMMSPSGSTKGLLRWKCSTSGALCTNAAATDSSSIIATTLFMAETRWGDSGAHPYQSDAIALLNAMTSVEQQPGALAGGTYNLFDLDAALPRKGSDIPDKYTPVDYLMPAFYEIWAKYDTERSDLWLRMSTNSRALLSKVANPVTGLYPEIVDYQGVPVPHYENYRTTTARTLFHLALDYLWNGPEPWVAKQNERLLGFFLSQGIDTYAAEYTPAGAPLLTYNTAAHRSLVALAAGTTTNPAYQVFLDVFIDEPIPTGAFRYYDGMLYMLSLLVLSGQMDPG